MDRVAVAAARHPPDGFAVDPHRFEAERDAARLVAALEEQAVFVAPTISFGEVVTCSERERTFERA